MRRSIEVQNILREASDLAAEANQPVTTGHVLLGILTIPNRGAQLMGDLRINADRILDAMSAVKRKGSKLREEEDLLETIGDHMYNSARRTGATLVSSLHLLLALTREKRSVAYRVFNGMGVPPSDVRTLALSRVTGPAPRAITQAAQRSTRAFDNEPDTAITVTDIPAAPQPERDTKPMAAVGRIQPGDTLAEAAPAPDKPRVSKTIKTQGEALGPTAEEQPYILDEESFPLLTSLGTNLSLLAAQGRLDPVIGRAELIESMIDTPTSVEATTPVWWGNPGSERQRLSKA